jgi:hypothetical protein
MSNVTSLNDTLACFSSYTPPPSQVHCPWVLKELANETGDYENLILNACPTIEDSCPQVTEQTGNVQVLKNCARSYIPPVAQRHCGWFLQQVKLLDAQPNQNGPQGRPRQFASQFGQDPRSVFSSQSQSQGRQNSQSQGRQNSQSQGSQNSQSQGKFGQKQNPQMATRALEMIIIQACPELESTCPRPQQGDVGALPMYRDCLMNYTSAAQPHCDWILSEIKNMTNMTSQLQVTATAGESTIFRTLVMPILPTVLQDIDEQGGAEGMNNQGNQGDATNATVTSLANPSNVTTTNVTTTNVTTIQP